MTPKEAVKLVLANGQSCWSSFKGTSMLPLVKSGQSVLLAPCKIDELQVGDIIYCRVHGKDYCHLVKAIDKTEGRVLIGNNKGRVNGWASQVYGKVVEKKN